MSRSYGSIIVSQTSSCLGVALGISGAFFGVEGLFFEDSSSITGAVGEHSIYGSGDSPLSCVSAVVGCSVSSFTVSYIGAVSSFTGSFFAVAYFLL